MTNPTSTVDDGTMTQHPTATFGGNAQSTTDLPRSAKNRKKTGKNKQAITKNLAEKQLRSTKINALTEHESGGGRNPSRKSTNEKVQ
ncbi:hypothetical protein CHS0354_007878 [Potamilus streckersoni]|uniref:Uncharacterized protein n=1 Tax=Potamilus streckersoni TaxID=2493646 RepID=A0AAE0W4U5_9BIVA|nr:hypothetical protein CHS0354_007878 [Potamilus streckersoni]